MKTLFRRSSQLSAYSCQPKTSSVTPSSLCQRSIASGICCRQTLLLPIPTERCNASFVSRGVSGCACNRESRSVPISRLSCSQEPFSALSRSRDSFAIADAARDNARSALRGGGGERNRTDDLLLAKQALSQLSYTPANSGSARVCRAVGDSGCSCNRESPHRA